MTDIQEIIQNLLKTHTDSCMTEKPQYKCEICHDNGWVEVDPETRTVKKCKCTLAREAEERMKRSGLENALTTQTFETFKVNTDIQRQLSDMAHRYTEAVTDKDRRRPWMYIGGNPGSGKTHICTAVCGDLLTKKNIAVRYMQWVEEARKLKALVNAEDFEEMLSDYINVSVLYIDDLLKQKYTDNPTFTDADIKIAFTILNNRYLQNKPTIISTEWNLIDQLLTVDEGTFSRVYECSKGFTFYIPRDPANNYRLTA